MHRLHVAQTEAQLWGPPPAAGAAEIALPLLLRLRWLAAAGQSALLAVAAWAGAQLPYAWMGALAALLACSNAWLVQRRDRAELARALPWILCFDIVLLTAQLALSGGPHNPFSAFYVVYVALAAVALRVRGTAWIALLTGSCYAAMFPYHVSQPLWEGSHAAGHTAGTLLDAHLVGMWIALSAVAALIATFVGRLSEQLVSARTMAARNDRLASLTTLAAGAAHELGSPLGTIAVAAREIERAAAPAAREDAQLIRAEVERCRQILDRMSGASSQASGRSAEEPLATILEGVRSDLGADGARLEIALAESARALRADAGALRRALGTLVRNALDASSGAVTVRVAQSEREIRFEVVDRGAGIAADALRHLGEPFFTTKEPGRGTGLGLYVVRLIAERLGGQLTLHTAPGEGTAAVLALPQRSVRGDA